MGNLHETFSASTVESTMKGIVIEPTQKSEHARLKSRPFFRLFREPLLYSKIMKARLTKQIGPANTLNDKVTEPSTIIVQSVSFTSQ